MNIYLSNVSFHTTAETLAEMFGAFGAVNAVRMVEENNNGAARKSAYVEMKDAAQAHAAIAALDGREIQGRRLRVTMARDSFAHTPRSAGQATTATNPYRGRRTRIR